MGIAGQRPEEGRENERGGEKGALKRDGGNWGCFGIGRRSRACSLQAFGQLQEAGGPTTYSFTTLGG